MMGTEKLFCRFLIPFNVILEKKNGIILVTQWTDQNLMDVSYKFHTRGNHRFTNPVGKIAKKAVYRSTFLIIWHYNLSAELTTPSDCLFLAILPTGNILKIQKCIQYFISMLTLFLFEEFRKVVYQSVINTCRFSFSIR